jgi:hypothetical protein
MNYWEVISCYEDNTWESHLVQAASKEAAQKLINCPDMLHVFVVQEISNEEYEEFYEAT